MRKLLIVKTGSTLPALSAQIGDFEDWFVAGMGIESNNISIVDVREGAPLPVFNKISGVVVTGSHDMVTDRLAWSERTAEWLCRAVSADVPIMAVCYGHQLLAHALGGVVDYNLRGREMGTVDVFLTEEAREDSLLGVCRNPIRVQVSHAQVVVRLPEKAIRLGWSQDDPHQAFRIGDRAWGLQFHPEFDREIVRTYIEYHKAALIKEGKNPDGLIRNSEDTAFGGGILKRFAQIVQSQE